MSFGSDEPRVRLLVHTPKCAEDEHEASHCECGGVVGLSLMMNPHGRVRWEQPGHYPD
jgi:hypothetical protein